MPLMILGGIGFGVFTPTEAAAVACFYAFFVSTVIYRELKFKHIKKICENTILFSAPPLLVIVAMSAFSVMLTWQQIPQIITEKVLLLSSEPVTVLFLLLLTFLVLGFITDGFPIFFLVTPMLIPVANLVGIDLVHLGVLIVITVLLGNLTPPFGLLNQKVYDHCVDAGYKYIYVQKHENIKESSNLKVIVRNNVYSIDRNSNIIKKIESNRTEIIKENCIASLNIITRFLNRFSSK